MSHVLRYIAIYNLFTDSVSYTIRGAAGAGTIPVIMLLASPSGIMNSAPAEDSEEPAFDPYVIYGMINLTRSQTFTETRVLFYTASSEAHCVFPIEPKLVSFWRRLHEHWKNERFRIERLNQRM
jgi:hypothetical protein